MTGSPSAHSAHFSPPSNQRALPVLARSCPWGREPGVSRGNGNAGSDVRVQFRGDAAEALFRHTVVLWGKGRAIPQALTLQGLRMALGALSGWSKGPPGGTSAGGCANGPAGTARAWGWGQPGEAVPAGAAHAERSLPPRALAPDSRAPCTECHPHCPHRGSAGLPLPLSVE